MIFTLISIFICLSGFAQIRYAKIVYERKTNLFKKFKDDNVGEWLKEADKIKVDYFELYMNDTCSVFMPQQSELKETMSWATSKNTVYQNFNENKMFGIKPIWGEDLYVKDSLHIRKWKVTDSKRIICGYSCRKAVWYADSVTRIYAWYADELLLSTGPESFNGLPGTILGLATEDGGVIYFAKSVEQMIPDAQIITPKKTKDKVYLMSELKAKLTKEYGKEKWGKAMIKSTFSYW